MKLSACVACRLPVIELEGQFDLLDSFFISKGVPPEETAGEWHMTCLRGSNVGPAWQAARLRNFRDVRKFKQVAEVDGWVVLQDPHDGETIALGTTGEMLDLAHGSKKAARRVSGGLVFPRSHAAFHLELGDAALVSEIKDTLAQTSTYPVSALFSRMGLADRISDPVALEGAALRLDEELKSFWRPSSVSTRVEFGVFVPAALESYVVERHGSR